VGAPWQLIFLILGGAGMRSVYGYFCSEGARGKGVGAGRSRSAEDVGALLADIRKTVHLS